jgi:hypothetical protein
MRQLTGLQTRKKIFRYTSITKKRILANLFNQSALTGPATFPALGSNPTPKLYRVHTNLADRQNAML